MYLTDLSQEGDGGETVFPHLVAAEREQQQQIPLRVRPRARGALAWNNVGLLGGVSEEEATEGGAAGPRGPAFRCLEESAHFAAPPSPADGGDAPRRQKIILQRWYHGGAFDTLGRPSPMLSPPLPPRDSGGEGKTALLQCDGNEGQCRWYDEWGVGHLTEYNDWLLQSAAAAAGGV